MTFAAVKKRLCLTQGRGSPTIPVMDEGQPSVIEDEVVVGVVEEEGVEQH